MSDEVEAKREMLLSARLRVSPEAQEARSEAAERLVMVALIAAPPSTSFTLEQVEATGLLELSDGRPLLTSEEVKKALQRLEEKEKVSVTDLGTKQTYKLARSERQRLETEMEASRNRFNEVVDRIFENADRSPKFYRKPFQEAVEKLISELSAANVLTLIGEGDDGPPLNPASLHSVVEEIVQEYGFVDRSYFLSCLERFFESDDPAHNEVKWRVAQNEFVMQSLGLDKAGYSLSKKLFGGAVMYVDTNVLIHGLEKLAFHHRGFSRVCEMKDSLDLDLRVADVSLDELKGTASHKADLIRSVERQIPPDLVDKVGGLFYRVYKERVFRGDQSVSEAFSRWLNPSKPLEMEMGLKLDYDGWYGANSDATKTKELAKKLQSREGYRWEQAIHDALLLRRVYYARHSEDKPNTWILTLHNLLTHYKYEGDDRPLAITLDGFLQWVVTAQGYNDEDLRDSFAAEIRELLLPTGRFLHIDDFRMFARMDMECRNLPASDVEECIRVLKQQGVDLNPADAGDREQLNSKIVKFFTDPSREYSKRLEELRKELEESEELVAETKREKNRQILSLEEQLGVQEQELAEERERRQYLQLKQQSTRRALIASAGIVAGLAIIYLVIVPKGEGENIVQRVGDVWWIVVAFLGVSGVLSGLWIGREGLSALGPPVSWLMTLLPSDSD